MSLLVRTMIVLLLLSLISSCSAPFGKHLDIDADEVPVYPNAQNVIQESHDPDMGQDYFYTWSFTTSDTPDDVWQFYVDEMSRRWDIYDVSSPQLDDYSLTVKSCPIYYLNMIVVSNDEQTYNIVIEFIKDNCI